MIENNELELIERIDVFAVPDRFVSDLDLIVMQ